jgi:hypothetical protein
MIGVASLALAFASIWVYLPWLLWRVRVNRVIDQKLTGPDKRSALFSNPSYESYNKLTGAEYLDVLKDPRYVAERLFETAAKDADPQRRVEAFSALERLLVEAASPDLAQEFSRRVLRQAVAGALSTKDEIAAVTVVQDLLAPIGLDDGQRAAILERALKLARGPDSQNLLPFWVMLIGQIGGPAETEFLLELDDARDPKSFTFDQGSRLKHWRSPVLLDHIRRWLDDPARALGALDYTILPCTVLGRRLLLDVVLTPGRDDEVRRKAMRLLKRNCNGVDLLLHACDDPDRRRILGKFFGPDRYSLTTISAGLPAQLDRWSLPATLAEVKDPNDPRPELLKLRALPDYISFPWLTLLGGISPSYWGALRKRMFEAGKSQAEVEHIVREVVEGDLAIAQELAGRHDLRTPAEWERWYQGIKPGSILVTLGRWIEVMLAHPDLMKYKEFGGYIQATHSVAPELVPSFAGLAHAAPAGTRWRLCVTLLLYSDRTEDAPLLIDDIEQELRDHPTRFGDRNTWPILILRYRFGVNYFWDVAAWRRWWAKYQHP